MRTGNEKRSRCRGTGPTRRRGILLLLPCLLFGLLLSGCSSLERRHDALLVLGDLAAGEAPSRLKHRTQTPEREGLAYAVEDRDYVADVYHPSVSRRGALILVHGLTEAGRRDPRLVDFARTLARAGFTVMVPELEGLRDFSVGTREVQGIADAIRHATAELPAADKGTGLAAISFATGPALLAAMQPDTAHRVRFVVAVGGYYDLTDMLRYVTTGEDRGGAGRQARPPRREVRWVLLRSQLHRLDDAEDRERLDAIARRRLAGDEGPDPRISRLGPQGSALYTLVTNRDPARVEPLLEALPPPLLTQFEALDLASRHLDALEARLVLVHGPDDRVIPISHSRRLRDALPSGQARLFEAAGLGHVEVSMDWRDGWTLWRAIDHVLRLGETEETPR
ncbi:alpha/beta hydrolase [Halomonas urumqiensis]|nr:alpha/beta hydrolase [Halomonas urumqiensis]